MLHREVWCGREKLDLKKAKLNPKLHINMKRERRKFTNEFKAEVALEAIKDVSRPKIRTG
jgi:transposase-like protein